MGASSEIAKGGSIVFAASLIERALRLGATFLLSVGLGKEAFGAYTYAVTIFTIIAIFSPLGLDMGAVYFGAQYHNKDKAKQRSMIIRGFSITLFSGLVFYLATLLLSPHLLQSHQNLNTVAPALIFWSPLVFSVGILRSIKDMVGNAIVFQLLPSFLLLVGGALVMFFSLSIHEAFVFFVISIALSALMGIFRVWKRLRFIIKDATLPHSYSLKEQLHYSIPQSLAAVAFRLTMWTDILMLGILSTNAELGVYKIAAALAVIGSLPVNALATIFNPIIAKNIAENAHKELNKTLKTITRWLMSLSLPVITGMFLLPDLLLFIFGEEYASSRMSLVVLVGGQFIWVSCAMAMRLIPVSGHSTLTLINGLIAAGLNIALNWYFIPEYGSIGAAISTSITLGLWSLWRLVEIWHLLRCFPFTKYTGGLFFLSLSSALGLHFLLSESSMLVRLPIVLVLCTLLMLRSFYFGSEEADKEIKEKILRKIKGFTKKS